MRWRFRFCRDHRKGGRPWIERKRAISERSAPLGRMAPAVSENVKVVVRIRPMTSKEKNAGEAELVRVVSDRSVQILDQQAKQAGRAQTALAYQFEKCFGQETTQEEMFDGCGVKELLDHALEGYSATVFAYGPTGSGKTFSVTGRPESIIKHGSGDGSDGVVIRASESLFDKVGGPTHTAGATPQITPQSHTSAGPEPGFQRAHPHAQHLRTYLLRSG